MPAHPPNPSFISSCLCLWSVSFHRCVYEAFGHPHPHPHPCSTKIDVPLDIFWCASPSPTGTACCCLSLALGFDQFGLAQPRHPQAVFNPGAGRITLGFVCVWEGGRRAAVRCFPLSSSSPAFLPTHHWLQSFFTTGHRQRKPPEARHHHPPPHLQHHVAGAHFQEAGAGSPVMIGHR